MKSIIFEAPSVIKAIEQSWIKTGKPQNFSIKILELEERNFLGMTKKPAKIAFFFEEKFEKKVKSKSKPLRTFSEKPPTLTPSLPNSTQGALAYKQEKTLSQKQVNLKQEPSKKNQLDKLTQLSKHERRGPRIKKTAWTDPMIDTSKKWVLNMLEKMDLSHIKFTVNTSNYNIKFHFEKPLLENKMQQKELFRNFASLLMQTLRYKFKKQFRNLKAVFTSN